MVLALDNDNGAVVAFQSITEAVAHCKGVDVEDGYWRFFAEDGSPFEARWGRLGESEDAANASRTYTLHRAMSGLWLQERLAEVVSVTGCGLTSVVELVDFLKVNRGKRATAEQSRPAARRGR